MNNLMNVLGLLFKEVSVTSIIDNEISYKIFDLDSFLRLGRAHMKQYSNDEIENLYYYLQSEIITFRKHIYDMDVRETEQNFNVFDALFVFAKKVLKEDGREPMCRYRYLDEWRQMSLLLGEDLFITAYLAAKDAYHGARRNWFFWKNAISTDNIYLKHILERGLAENHFHLKGSAPSFDISWLSLMNHMLDYSFKKKLDKIDAKRLHYTVAYSSRHPEDSLWILVLQAALIRVYLFCVLEKKAFTFGHHIMDVKKIESYIHYERVSDQILIEKDAILRSYDEYSGYTMTFGQILRLNEKTVDGLDEITMQVFKNLLIHVQYTRTFFEKWDKESVDMRTLLIKSLPLIEFIYLDQAEDLLSSEEYYQLCESESAEYIFQLLQEPKKMVDEAENIQDMIHHVSDYVRWKNRGGRRTSISDYREGKNGKEVRHEYSRLDYFLMPIIDDVHRVPGYKALMAGERYFLYRYLRYAYTRKENKDRLLNFFYRYIVIKNRVWNELIQTNGNVGFNNFLQYQNRKEEFIEGTIYEKYFLQIAVAGTLTSQNIKRLETRIAPKGTAKKNHAAIMSQIENINLAFEEEYQLNNIKDIDQYTNAFFYVFHFIKERDDELQLNAEDSAFRCRHYEKRKQIYRQSMAVSELREHYYQSAKYVYGIDAASEEIVCRPEVFAQAFRYLKRHVVYEKNIFGKKYPGLPNLKATYHAGEDFLDLLDGLRAIDEAIYFLDMQCGDRLGHALALGIDVQDWYESKGYKILLSQQEYLDNLAWLYGKIRKFNILGFEDVKMYIEKEFNEMIRAVYLNNINEEYLKAVISKGREKSGNNQEYSYFTGGSVQFDINSYYDAWKLRCDNPECYRMGFFKNQEALSLWNEYAVNKKYPENYKIRYNPAAAFIYHCYHYVPEVKICGNKKIEKHIPRNMIRCVSAVQREMQSLVAAKGIGIECNPSSNYLIGTFHEYKKHPISKFYNNGLAVETEELKDCPQLYVSINTDDQGVFYTSLENEYALMALAMEKAVDDQGNMKYNRMGIYAWIDEIRKMGLIQSFKSLKTDL